MIFVAAVYNNGDEVKNFIEEQLLSQTFVDFKIFVVVNSGKIQPINDARIKIIYPNKNTGYLGALKFVLETEKPNFHYITLCNTDIQFPSNTFVENYVKKIEKKQFSVAAPSIKSALTGDFQNPFYDQQITKRKLKILNFVYQYYPMYLIYQTFFYIKHKFRKSTLIQNVNPYALHGSFLTLSSDFFAKGGTLNYPVFFFGEELFLAEEAKRIGLKNLFVNDLQIVHKEHSTTGIYKNKTQVNYLKQSVHFILNTLSEK